MKPRAHSEPHRRGTRIWINDRRSPRQIAEQFHTAIADAKLVVIPEAGHVSNMEQPEVLNAHVRRFCSERDAD